MPRPNERKSGDATSIGNLGRRLDQCRARARRHWRDYRIIDEKLDPTASAAAHANWSNAVDYALRVAEAISRQPAHDSTELSTKFEALWWWIKEDDGVLDAALRRWLARFRKSLRQLSQEQGSQGTPK
jgi:hypothetical protein